MRLPLTLHTSAASCTGWLLLLLLLGVVASGCGSGIENSSWQGTQVVSADSAQTLKHPIDVRFEDEGHLLLTIDEMICGTSYTLHPSDSIHILPTLCGMGSGSTYGLQAEFIHGIEAASHYRFENGNLILYRAHGHVVLVRAD